VNIDRFKHQHHEILGCIADLRTQVRSGITANATEIARLIVQMSSTIKLHLAVEDSVLYPALQRSRNTSLALMGKRFQDEMTNIAAGYLAFSRRWNSPANVAAEPEAFRADANSVLKVLYDRMQKENTDFYPAIEAA
jgi:hypothetical protein